MTASTTWEQLLKAEGLAPMERTYRGKTHIYPQSFTAPKDRKREEEFLEYGRFASQFHRAVWALYAKGMSARNIQTVMRRKLGRLDWRRTLRAIQELRDACAAYHTVSVQVVEEFAAFQGLDDITSNDFANRSNINLWRKP